MACDIIKLFIFPSLLTRNFATTINKIKQRLSKIKKQKPGSEKNDHDICLKKKKYDEILHGT